MRRYLICDCGNRDDEDVSSMASPYPPCSADCGRTMQRDPAHHCILEVDSPSYPPGDDERRQCGCPQCLKELT